MATDVHSFVGEIRGGDGVEPERIRVDARLIPGLGLKNPYRLQNSLGQNSLGQNIKGRNSLGQNI